MSKISRTSLKQKIIISICSMQILLFVISQAPFVDLTKLGPEVAAAQMSFTFETLKKIKDWRGSQNSFFINIVNPYFAITELGYPSYYFFLGAPKTSIFYSFEFTDKVGSPLPDEPWFSTCPLAWSECLAGKYWSDNLRMPVFEMILIGQESIHKPAPPYFFLERGKQILKSKLTDKFIAFVAYELPVKPWFEPTTEQIKRKVIHVTN